MGARTWQHVVTQAPARWVPDLLPDEVAGDGATLQIRHEASLEGAFWGPGTRRFRAVWTPGRIGCKPAKAYVEVRPHSSSSSELVVSLEAPTGLAGAFLWNRGRLADVAEELSRSLRDRVEIQAAKRRERATGPVRTVRPA